MRDSFKKFRQQFLALDLAKDRDHLDTIPLTQYLKDYPAELTEWWDAYGPSNWGAKSADTSALVAAFDLKEMAGDEPDPRVTLPGGNGALSQKLVEILRATFADQMLVDATIVAVEPQKDEVHITSLQGTQVQTVGAKFVIMATPKFITARVVSGLSEDQFGAMTSIRYCPYPVINMIFDRPVYTKAYDTWSPGNAFTDFVVADWVVRNQSHDTRNNGGGTAEAGLNLPAVAGLARPASRANILTFYVPMAQSERSKLLHEDSCRKIAANVLDDFKKLLPEFNVDPIEVHFYRRGHPMFVPVPGTFTRTIPVSSAPLDRVFFANTDSIGPVSDIGAAVEAAQHAAEWVDKRMAGAKPSRVGA